MGNSELMQLRNLGLRSCNWLEEVGISTIEGLRDAGSVNAFCRVRNAGFHPSLNLLYALEGALQDCHWTDLSEDCRSTLLQAAEDRKQDAA
ncbi:MAG: TfoX/Sxy family protein [Gammaproteobacteria bacterium]|nr:TfoX/Sxy family protein [Gammaproteobacteria bacterium]